MIISNYLLCPPNEVWETYCVCSVSYYFCYCYYYYSSSSFFLPPKVLRHISLWLLNGNQWNCTGMLSTMSRCEEYFRNFQNGRRCHGNSQNAKKLKNTKMIIAGYSPNRNWWNLIGTTSISSGTRWAKIIGIGWTNFAAVAMETKKGGDLNFFWIPFIKLHEHL